MNETVQAITWEAPEHRHIEKGNDWFWAVSIIAIAGAVTVFLFGNFLFAILILVAAVTLVLVALRKPEIVPFAVTTRGVRVDDTLHPYASLESFCVDVTNYDEPHLLLKSRKLYLPLIVIPIPEEYIDDIDEIIASRLPEEELEEPFFNIVLEFFGF